MDGHVEMHQVVVARPGDPYNSGGNLTSTVNLVDSSKLSPIFVYIHPC